MRSSVMVRMFVLCTLLVMAAVPAIAGQNSLDRVPAGLDYWQTLAFGATAYSFEKEPLPAGFFCEGSPAFKGVVQFEGVPLRTEPAGILGTTDTVIERLDEAVFNARGIAKARLRARALHIQSSSPIKTVCGDFKVTATLTDDQPVTSITFRRQNKYGGTFDADLRLRVRIGFENLQNAKAFSVVRDLYLPTVGDAPFACGKAAQIACATPVEPSPGTSSITLVADGRPLSDNPLLDKAAATTCVTGCQCNGHGQCMPTYCWHDPCATAPYDCELHFTTPPCRLGYEQFCDDVAVQESFLEQLRALEARGILQEKPEVVLQKQMRSVEQIEKEQAAKDKELQKK
jgi:hypothetical protein